MTWDEVLDRLANARDYWLGTTGTDGAPHAAPVWAVTADRTLYIYSERHTVKARNLVANPRVVLHLANADHVVIVYGKLRDLGHPQSFPAVLDAFASKYDRPGDAPYLPAADEAFDVLYHLVPSRALIWSMNDWENSQQRWYAEPT